MIIRNTTKAKVDAGLQAIRNEGGYAAAGNVNVQGFRARYAFDEDNGNLTVVIDDKPWFAPTSMIEGKIREFFS